MSFMSISYCQAWEPFLRLWARSVYQLLHVLRQLLLLLLTDLAFSTLIQASLLVTTIDTTEICAAVPVYHEEVGGGSVYVLLFIIFTKFFNACGWVNDETLCTPSGGHRQGKIYSA